MTASFSRALPLWIAFAAGCGARSMLAAGEPPAGTGGATTTTSSATTGATTSTTTSATGTGGALPACSPNFVGQEVVIGVPDVLARRPALVAVGSSAALVFGADTTSSADPSRLGQTFISAPWDEWPTNIDTPIPIATDGGRAFAAAPLGTATYALAWSPLASGSKVFLDEAVNPQATAGGGLLSFGGEVFALSISSGRRVVGVREQSPSGAYTARFAWLEGAAPSPAPCASAPLTGHLFPRGDTFFAAVSDDPTGTCAGAPTALRLYPRFPEPATVVIPLDEEVRRVRVAPRGTGAWVVSQSHVQEPASFVRVDPVLADGTIDPQFGTFHPALTADTDIDAVALGDKLAIAVILQQGKRLHLVVVEPDGLRSTLDLDVTDLIEELSLLASPDGRMLLIAWTDVAKGNLHFVRVGC